MKRLHTYISSTDAALEQAPEVFEPVRVDVPLGVTNRVINYVVRVITGKAIVGLESIGVNLGAFKNVFPNRALKFRLPNVLKHFQNHARRFFAACAFQQSHNRSHSHRSGASNLPLSLVHVAGLTADESFIHFDVASEIANRSILDSQPDTVKHEPRGLLSDAK